MSRDKFVVKFQDSHDFVLPELDEIEEYEFVERPDIELDEKDN